MDTEYYHEGVKSSLIINIQLKIEGKTTGIDILLSNQGQSTRSV